MYYRRICVHIMYIYIYVHVLRTEDVMMYCKQILDIQTLVWRSSEKQFKMEMFAKLALIKTKKYKKQNVSRSGTLHFSLIPVSTSD